MADLLVTALAYLHVLSAMGWLGGALLTTFAVGPNLRKMAPAAGLEFNAKVLPNLVRFVQSMVGSTFFFGLLLLYFLYGGDLSWLTTTVQGWEIAVGVTVAVIAAAIAFSFTLPSFTKVGKLAKDAIAAGQPPSPDMMKYGKRARQGSLTVIALLLIVLAMMVAAGFGYIP